MCDWNDYDDCFEDYHPYPLSSMLSDTEPEYEKALIKAFKSHSNWKLVKAGKGFNIYEASDGWKITTRDYVNHSTDDVYGIAQIIPAPSN